MTEKTERIIVIDDEKRMCESLSALLQGGGIEVRAFQDSPAAVEMIRNERVDLVVTDIKMPHMDGLQILKAVKEIDDGIPVILMTGYGSMDTALEAIAQGAYNYLLKPVEFAQLELAVKRALEKRRSDLAQRSLMEQLKLSNFILESRISELNALYEAGKSIGSTANLTELLKQLVALASAVTNAEIGSIMLVDDRGEYLTIEAATGLDEDIIRSTRLPIGASIAGYVAKTGEPLIIENIEHDERFARMNRERYSSGSLLSVPLIIKNNVLGVINMANRHRGDSFDKNDLRLLTTFASQAAVAVDDARQFENSRRRLVEYQILHEFYQEVPSIQSWSAFRTVMVDKLNRVFPIRYAVWFIWDDYNKVLTPDGVFGISDIPSTESGKIDLQRVRRDDLLLEAEDLATMDLDDIQRVSLYVGELIRKSKAYPEPRQAYLAVPIRESGDLTAVFYIGADDPHPYSDDDISIARLVISQATYLFEKEKALLNATRLMTMGNMISEISHDLRKPLTSIKGALQILKQRWPQIMDKSDLFRMAEDEIHRMNELVRELVDFSNPNKYETNKLDLRQIVMRASELVAPDMRKHNIDFESQFDSQVSWDVIINKNQFMEIFLNLFINAIDAMPDGGKLRVEGLVEKPDHKKSLYLAIKVMDSGVGIRKENLAKIFDRYYTTKETGTGLGLSVVERIISAHNGTLSVHSEEGDGTTFTVYLPYEP
ncbi:MAG: GAF domain-containing protein [candidate division Zixibacteria bacterium]|jgi:signal transduction histidine kinase/FixJ family two-component response regulator|nr:GAF domain-containing protein [candidate division Zixibacteria bacterium]